MMQKTLNGASWIVLGLAAVMIVYFIFYMVYPFKPIEFRDAILPVMKPVIKIGEVVPIMMRFTRYTDMSSTVTRRLVDTNYVIMYPDIEISRCAGEYDFVSSSTSIPIHILPGEYYLEFGFIYKIHPLRTVVINKRTEKFRVVK